eukprot:Pgem_evm2s4381
MSATQFIDSKTIVGSYNHPGNPAPLGVTRRINFSKPFTKPPIVMLSLTKLDQKVPGQLIHSYRTASTTTTNCQKTNFLNI